MRIFCAGPKCIYIRGILLVVNSISFIHLVLLRLELSDLEHLCRGHLFQPGTIYLKMILLLNVLVDTKCAGAIWLIPRRGTGANSTFITVFDVKFPSCLFGNSCAGANRFLKGTVTIENKVDVLNLEGNFTSCASDCGCSGPLV